ncbi:MAG TPA: MFS transporter [Stellaceae bacterium]|nr:MFS transporter [Stellaceae bacterium]
MTTAVEGASAGPVLRVLVPLAAGVFLSNFCRSQNAVLSPYLISDLGLSASSLGLLSSVYFFTSAVFQAPFGLLMDRYGPRRVQGSLMGLVAVGLVMFGLGSDDWVLIAGRALMGVGASVALMTSFQAIVLWFPPQRWPSFNGWIMAAGGFGSLCASVPTALLLHLTTWRGLMLITAAATVAGVVAVFAVVPEHPGTQRHSSVGEQLRAFASIFRDRLFWRLAPVSMAMSGSSLAFAGLWAGPWLKDVGGRGPDGIALSLLVLTALNIVGFLCIGNLAGALTRRGLTLTHIIGGMTTLSVLCQLPLLLPSVGGQWLVMVALGAFSGATVLVYPVLNAHFPPALAGRVSTAINLFFFTGAFLLQYLMGAIIDLFAPVAPGTYPPIAYETAFGAMILIEAASLAWFLVPAGRRGNG